MSGPRSLHTEHEALHAELDRATRDRGAVGAAAREVARVMHGHFVREDAYAVPPLGLLPALAKGHVTKDMAGMVPLVQRLRAEMPLMLEEHRAILGAVQALAAAARDDHQPRTVELARRLEAHIVTEEEILYPAALLVGAYLELTLGK